MATVSYGGDRAGGSASRADLVIGMQLLRAVNMQSIRLQLAMLRRDRQPTMESLDSLVAMDREIEHFIEEMAAQGIASGELLGIAQLVAAQKRALAEEKLYLTAGTAGPRFRPDEAGTPDPQTEPEAPPVRRWTGRVSLAMLVLTAAAGAAWFALAGPALLAGV